jgi:ribonuclease Z
MYDTPSKQEEEKVSVMNNDRVLLATTYVSGLLLLSVLGSATAQEVPRSEAQLSRTKLVMLGTGTPVPDPDRLGPAIVVLVDNVPYLIDCGVGLVRRWAGAVRANNFSASTGDLKTLFVTHLHSDHTLGYADLIFTPWTNAQANSPGGNRPLEAYGPEGLSAMTNHLIAAYADDIRIRTNGGRRSGPAVNTHEIAEGVVYKDERVTVNAFLVPHGAWPQAFGYRCKTPDKTIVISGDTAYSPAIAEQCNGCDILVHEGGSANSNPYNMANHTSASELAKVALAAKPKLLVLYHQGSANEEGLRVIRSEYRGAVVVASDLQVFE